MKPLFVPGAGIFVSAEVCADLRHGALRDLRAAQRDQAYVSPDTVAAVEMMDVIGAAWFENKTKPPKPSEAAQVDPSGFGAVDWESMDVLAAAKELEITEQATRRLLFRGTLHGERGHRAWRVCAASVAARLAGTKCQHMTERNNPCH